MADESAGNSGSGSSSDDASNKPKPSPAVPAIDTKITEANSEKNEELSGSTSAADESLMLTVSGTLIAQKGDSGYQPTPSDGGGGGDGGA